MLRGAGTMAAAHESPLRLFCAVHAVHPVDDIQHAQDAVVRGFGHAPSQRAGESSDDWVAIDV